MFGIVQKEQETCLTAVLRRITEAGGTLNPDKWKFSQWKLKFLAKFLMHNVSKQIQTRCPPSVTWNNQETY